MNQNHSSRSLHSSHLQFDQVPEEEKKHDFYNLDDGEGNDSEGSEPKLVFQDQENDKVETERNADQSKTAFMDHSATQIM